MSCCGHDAAEFSVGQHVRLTEESLASGLQGEHGRRTGTVLAMAGNSLLVQRDGEPRAFWWNSSCWTP